MYVIYTFTISFLIKRKIIFIYKKRINKIFKFYKQVIYIYLGYTIIFLIRFNYLYSMCRYIVHIDDTFGLKYTLPYSHKQTF